MPACMRVCVCVCVCLGARAETTLPWLMATLALTQPAQAKDSRQGVAGTWDDQEGNHTLLSRGDWAGAPQHLPRLGLSLELRLRRFNPSCPGPAPIPTGSQVVSSLQPPLGEENERRSRGRESGGGRSRQKAKQRLRQRQAELRAEGVRTHTSTQTSHLGITRGGLGLKGVIGAGAPCGERVTARSPGPAISTPAPPRTPAPPPTRTPLSMYTDGLVAPGSPGATRTPPPLHGFCGLAGSQA